MSLFKLQLHQLSVGTGLPFDTFDADGKLLLRKGWVVQSEQQLEKLLERGLYSDVPPAVWAGGAPAPGAAAASPAPTLRKQSVFALITQVQAELEQLLQTPAAADFATRLGALAAQLQRAYRLDGDAALASIQLLQSGRYAVRRMVHSALLSEMMLCNLGEDAPGRQRVLCAALSMNLSMLDLQDALYSQATPPSSAQRAQVHAHPLQSVAMLQALGVQDAVWLKLVAQHHETIDGKGYPAGAQGTQIARDAQLLSLVDRYGAMATGRGYRAAALPNVVLKQIFAEKDKSVNAQLVGLLIKSVGLYPPGSLVELANRDLAVVVKRMQNAGQPLVKCVRTAMNEVLEQPRKRQSSEPNYAITRLLDASAFPFKLDPDLLWDQGFEPEGVP